MRVVDAFAGLGGFTEGARQAGCTPVWSGNHWPLACEQHKRNHPESTVVCQDLQQFDWYELPRHDLLLASPACQGFARARGVDRPRHDKMRATAWAVVSALEACRPRATIIENVPEMQQWSLFPSWLDALARLGYRLSINQIDSQYFGVPQSRKRIFMVGYRDRAPRPLKNTRPCEELVTLRSVLDLNDIGFPIDDKARIAMGKRVLADPTKERIAGGRSKFGRYPFFIPYHSGNNTGYSIDKPIWAVTTRDDAAIVNGDHMRILTVDEIRQCMGFPDHYLLPKNKKDAKHLLGNSVCPPVAREIIREVMNAA